MSGCGLVDDALDVFEEVVDAVLGCVALVFVGAFVLLLSPLWLPVFIYRKATNRKVTQ